jgi:tetratricopeptide (TPR) repeat protein
VVSRAAEILQDPNDRAQALALYRKAITAKQALVAADPTNAEFQRLVAYDQFAMAEVLANMNDNNAALAQDHIALAAFQKLAAADPANAQFQQDIGQVRADMGQVLTNLGKPTLGIEQFRLSLAALEKFPESRSPQSIGGFAVITDELWLGKAYVLMASSGKAATQQTAELCRQADSWFSKCLSAFQALRDHAPPQYGGANRVHEIKTETLRCEHLLRRANPPPSR